MKIKSIECEFLQIPFKTKFAHASALRERSETFIVKIITSTENVGIGEACPRHYVTSETLESCRQFLEMHSVHLKKIETLNDIVSTQALWSHEIDLAPSAWCAIELALLDALAKEQTISVESLLNISTNQKTQKLKYSAVLGIASSWPLLKRTLRYRLLGFTDFKVKISGNVRYSDSRALHILNLLGVTANHIRLDGNNLWSTADDAIASLCRLKGKFWAIEEPIKATNYKGLIQIATQLNCQIILDESFLNLQNVIQVIQHKDIFIPNLRISKLGGVLRTMEIIDALEKNGCRWIMGSHVGETSLLTRASLLLMQKHSTYLPMALEGGFGTHLLEHDPFSPELKLGVGAHIKFKNFSNHPGWGMTYNTRSFE